MSILAKEDRRDLVWAMRTSLLEQVRSGVLTEGKKAAAENFIINEGTYEQLLNLAFNPERDTNYQPIEVLEKVALEAYSQVLDEATKAVEVKEEVVTESTEVVEESVLTRLEEAKKKGGAKAAITKAGKQITKAVKGGVEKVKTAAEKAGKPISKFLKTPAGKKLAVGTKYAAAAGVGAMAAKALAKRREKKAE